MNELRLKAPASIVEGVEFPKAFRVLQLRAKQLNRDRELAHLRLEMFRERRYRRTAIWSHMMSTMRRIAKKYALSVYLGRALGGR